MAKQDWRGPFFAGYDTPYGFRYRPSTEVPPGGEDLSTRLEAQQWDASSWVGFTYDGPDIGDFPLETGYISGALRTSNSPWGVNASHPFGFIMRQQTLLSLDATSLDPLSSVNMYMAGIYGQSSEMTPILNCAVFKIINGSAIQLGPTFFVTRMAAGSFIQLELKLENSGPNVEISYRSNGGTEVSDPGSTGWTNWSLITTDTSPGVLINGGYWGFGQGIISGSFAGGGGNYNYIDRVRIGTGNP